MTVKFTSFQINKKIWKLLHSVIPSHQILLLIPSTVLDY